jgi:radical SAM protein with 4Fe4S-binding SPASM domain
LLQFKKIYIEVTNRCNLSCSFCLPSRRPKRSMPPAEFAGILQKIEGYTEYIYLHVLGEAMLHPDFERLLDIAGAQGLQINLTTNGTLLAAQGWHLLSRPFLRQVNISLHCIEEPDLAGSFDGYMDGVLGFLAAAGSPPPVFINLRLWNLQEHPSLLQAKIIERLAAYFNLPEITPRMPVSGRSLPLAPKIFLNLAHRFDWPHAPAPDLGGSGTCRGLKDHIAILVDGTVVPCCLDAEGDIALGNIHRQRLEDILAAPRATAIREGFSRRQALDPLCRRCRYKQRFG